jgi:hypothetical protein
MAGFDFPPPSGGTGRGDAAWRLTSSYLSRAVWTRADSMLTQTFDLTNQTWKNRERQRRLANRLVPPSIVAVGVALAIWLWIRLPGEHASLTIGLVAFGVVALIGVLLVVNQSDPVGMTISGSTLTFTYLNGHSYSVSLDRKRAAAALLDQSAVPNIGSNPKGTLPPYLVSFGLGQEVIPLTAEAHAALLQALPRVGLALVKSGPDPLERRATRHVFRRPG